MSRPPLPPRWGECPHEPFASQLRGWGECPHEPPNAPQLDRVSPQRISLAPLLGTALAVILAGCDKPASYRVSSPSDAALPGTPTPAPAPSFATNPPAIPAPAGMVWIPGGEFLMGGPSADSSIQQHAATHPGDPVCSGLLAGFPDAQPAHRVRVSGFWMDLTEVTNAEFDKFIRATGYITVAERKPTAEQYPGADPEMLVPGSVVFTPPESPISLENPLEWWSYTPGANWRHPFGPQSDLTGKENHPVVHVCFDDAVAYCKWAGKRLPTEAEWEFAARGGLDHQEFAWGSEANPGGKWMANSFQGSFPVRDTGSDGFRGLAPIRSFPPNGFGLFEMAGNAWEWCADWYRPDTYAQRPAAGLTTNPSGPSDSHDPDEPGIPKRVQRGGSYLCSDQYCARFRIGTRGKGAADTGSTHVSFRCVKSPQ